MYLKQLKTHWPVLGPVSVTYQQCCRSDWSTLAVLLLLLVLVLATCHRVTRILNNLNLDISFFFRDAKQIIINHSFGPSVGFILECREPRLRNVPAAQPRVLSLRWRCICLVYDKIKDNITWLLEISDKLTGRAAGFRSLLLVYPFPRMLYF